LKEEAVNTIDSLLFIPETEKATAFPALNGMYTFTE